MSFLAPTDFVGLFEQSVNEFTTPKEQAYIDEYEVDYLTCLLGASMYAEFIADLNPTPAVPASVPVDAKFTVIFEPFATDDGNTNGLQHISKGMREMLKGFIMFEYARDNQFDFAITGATKNTFSNAETFQLNGTNAIKNYNWAIETYQQIQWYIDDNPLDVDYDNFNGKRKAAMIWL